MGSPNLIDYSAKNYLFNTLQQCHDTRISVYYYALNVGIIILFVGISGSILYYCYTQKPTDYERQQDLLKKQQYIASKIRYYQEEHKQSDEAKSSSITNLPFIRV